MKENAVLVAAVFYAAMVVVTFGPATVESKIAEAKHEATCEPQPTCRVFGPSIADGVFKATFWPFWLSYRLAESIQ